MKSASLVLLASGLLLAACNGDAPAANEGTASGEVLQGTISDDMLPLEELRSTAPQAAAQSDGAPAAGAAAAEAEPAVVPEAAPAEPATESAAE